ncbi:hypothetical protein [Roseovarius sp. A-2]|uniref:hypothetical protein n=1 Tax=Roseovarius sp. A-2 TaxID=1570360 RepID=UPI0020CAC52A|nr:hypothetical protein [Roseovarius sp. A-2]
MSHRYVEMSDRGELVKMGDTTVPVGRFLASVVERLNGQAPAAIAGDRFRHAEFLEALRDAGLDRVPFIWRGFGWKDGSEDIERTRRAVFEGQVRTVPSLLLRSAFAGAITLVDPAGNHKLAAGRSTGRVDPVAATFVAVAQGQRMKRAPAISGGRMAWA